MKFFKVMMWITVFPIMIMWVIFKTLFIDVLISVNKSTKPRGGVMCGAGGVSSRGKRSW